jgi:hypothetical protein
MTMLLQGRLTSAGRGEFARDHRMAIFRYHRKHDASLRTDGGHLRREGVSCFQDQSRGVCGDS